MCLVKSPNRVKLFCLLLASRKGGRRKIRQYGEKFVPAEWTGGEKNPRKRITTDNNGNLAKLKEFTDYSIRKGWNIPSYSLIQYVGTGYYAMQNIRV
jgi:hypothetical protein